MASRTLPRTKSTKLQLGVEFYKAPTASDNGLGIVVLSNRSTTHGLERPTAREVVAAYDFEFGRNIASRRNGYVGDQPSVGEANERELQDTRQSGIGCTAFDVDPKPSHCTRAGFKNIEPLSGSTDCRGHLKALPRTSVSIYSILISLEIA